MEFVILSAARNLSEKITIGGSIVDSLMQVSGLFKKLSISGNFANSSVDAGSLSSIKVKGLISGNPADGLDENRVQMGRFKIQDASFKGTIDSSKSFSLRKVKIFVG